MGSREKLLEKMLSQPPEVTFAEFDRFMVMHGWKKTREKRSHVIFFNSAGRMLTVPGSMEEQYPGPISSGIEGS